FVQAPCRLERSCRPDARSGWPERREDLRAARGERAWISPERLALHDVARVGPEQDIGVDTPGRPALLRGADDRIAECRQQARADVADAPGERRAQLFG